ncbi:MAG: A/G-specific adenine glycosylase [Planctomycetes bacterium]|nr:A/G-specific adenine glycosylase [Planctomycetota bacterium]
MSPAFRKALADWYRRHARDLPWRHDANPYRVWVSEIMLQQTRVEAVREHFTRFVKRFPTVRSLADADEEDVLQAWSGLGYYRRARMLHAAAKLVVGRHEGRIPGTRADVLALPGVGAYTAGAILSIAFNRPEPIVDGNVERVFARLYALDDDVKSKSARAWLWRTAGEYIEGGAREGHSPGVLNQGLMELGAVICKPAPDCPACPVRRWCKGNMRGNAALLPIRPARPGMKTRRYLFAAVRDADDRVLMVRREQNDRGSLLPAGMWELPHTEWRGTKPDAWRSIEQAHGLQLRPCARVTNRKHTIMGYRLTLAVQPCAGDAVETANRRWFTTQEASNGAIASATRKLLVCLT